MNYLTRWDPYREMLGLRSMFDRFFDTSLASADADWQPLTWNLALDVSETDDEYRVSASLPGIDPDDLEITYDSNVLTIKGETKSEREEQTENYLLKERRAGAFYRAVRLPESVDPEQAESHYEDGILKITLPKMPEKQPRRIKVDTGGRPQSLSTGERETMQESSGTAEERKR